MVAITENYNNEQIENPVRTVLGNRSYCSTIKYGKKICVVDDSYIRRTKKDLLLCAKETGGPNNQAEGGGGWKISKNQIAGGS